VLPYRNAITSQTNSNLNTAGEKYAHTTKVTKQNTAEIKKSLSVFSYDTRISSSCSDISLRVVTLLK
jgi:hypothetical protein